MAKVTSVTISLLAFSWLKVAVSRFEPSYDIMDRIQRELNAEILLLSSPNITLTNLKRSYESLSLPLIHIHSSKFPNLVTVYDCPFNTSQPAEIHPLSNMPWRDKSKALLTWLMPGNFQDLEGMVNDLNK